MNKAAAIKELRALLELDHRRREVTNRDRVTKAYLARDEYELEHRFNRRAREAIPAIYQVLQELS